MGKEKFEEYLKTQDKKEDVVIDWELKKEQWIQEIEGLLRQVKKYIGKYKDSVHVFEEEYIVNEECIGSYQTRKLIVKFNHDTVTFTPIGKNIIGAKGRIDMEGKAGIVKFVLVGQNSRSPQMVTTIITNQQEKKEYDDKIKSLNLVLDLEKPVWKISTPPPHIQYLELNEDSFFDALMEAING